MIEHLTRTNTVTDSRVQRDKASKESAFIECLDVQGQLSCLWARETLADKLLWRAGLEGLMEENGIAVLS